MKRALSIAMSLLVAAASITGCMLRERPPNLSEPVRPPIPGSFADDAARLAEEARRAADARRVVEEAQWQRLQEQIKRYQNLAETTINIAGIISDAHCQGLKKQHDDPLHRPLTADDYALYLFIGLKRFVPEPPLDEYREMAETLANLAR